MKEQDQLYLRRCRQLIERKLAWGHHGQWTNQDFIRLSELIFEETGTNLSTTTLKRIWGKVKYDSVPHVSTLNVLAQFAGYADWRTFKMECSSTKTQEEQGVISQDGSRDPQQHIVQHTPANLSSQRHRRDKKVILSSFLIMLLLLVGGSALLGVLFSMHAKEKAQSSLAPKDFSFTAQPVTTGLPNTVIFEYDASAAPGDSIYIQLSKDEKQSVKVSKHEHRHSAMYYYPGAYQAQLLADDEVVRQHTFLIQTNGWLALLEHDPVPLYFEESIMNHGQLALPIEKMGITPADLLHNTPWVSYYNVHDFGDLYNDNFILETEIKSEFNKGKAVCKDSSLVIMYHDAPPLTIPLTTPGCLAKVDQILKEQSIFTEDPNLLAFGTDLSDWVQIRCEARDQHLRLLINQQLAYQGALPQQSSKIIGIAYRFHGTGAVNYLRLSQPDGQEVYYEDFEG